MIKNPGNKKILKWLPVIFGAGLIVSFFLPWVLWDGNLVSGYEVPQGDFIILTETKFGLGNPLPQLNFSFASFWLIPAGALTSMIVVAINKKWNLALFVTGALSLSLVAVFFFFTNYLIMLGVGKNAFAMLCPPLWLQTACAIGLIITTNSNSYTLLKKIAWIVVGPAFVFIGFLFMENYFMSETFSDTAGIKADYTVTAPELIQEFAANDSAANKKYREKIISVNGAASEVEAKSDSTFNIKFADSTGSYIIFSLEKNQFEKVKNIKAGDVITLKGSCSGSVYSEILSTTFISFKRSTLNKQ
jgi:hypothetical protein